MTTTRIYVGKFPTNQTPHHQHHDFEMKEADLDGLSPLARLPRCPRPGKEDGQEDGRELRRRPTWGHGQGVTCNREEIDNILKKVQRLRTSSLSSPSRWSSSTERWRECCTERRCCCSCSRKRPNCSWRVGNLNKLLTFDRRWNIREEIERSPWCQVWRDERSPLHRCQSSSLHSWQRSQPALLKPCPGSVPVSDRPEKVKV